MGTCQNMAKPLLTSADIHRNKSKQMKVDWQVHMVLAITLATENNLVSRGLACSTKAPGTCRRFIIHFAWPIVLQTSFVVCSCISNNHDTWRLLKASNFLYNKMNVRCMMKEHMRLYDMMNILGYMVWYDMYYHYTVYNQTWYGRTYGMTEYMKEYMIEYDINISAVLTATINSSLSLMKIA